MTKREKEAKRFQKIVAEHNANVRANIAKVCSLIEAESTITLDLSKIKGSVEGYDLLEAVRKINNYIKTN